MRALPPQRKALRTPQFAESQQRTLIVYAAASSGKTVNKVSQDHLSAEDPGPGKQLS